MWAISRLHRRHRIICPCWDVLEAQLLLDVPDLDLIHASSRHQVTRLLLPVQEEPRPSTPYRDQIWYHGPRRHEGLALVHMRVPPDFRHTVISTDQEET